MHAHPAAVVVFLTGTQARFRFPDSQTAEGELKANECRYMESLEHATEIVGPEDLHMLVIELK